MRGKRGRAILALAYRHAFSQNLRVCADARVGVEWFPWHTIGFGAQYGGTRVRLDRDARSDAANLAINLHGPSLFAHLRF